LKSESSQEIILEKDEAPEDKYNLIYFTMMVYGVAMLAPWNAVLSTMHFYKEELPGTNIDFMIAFAMNGIMIFVVLACVFFTKDKLANRFLKVNMVFLVTSVVMVLVPITVRKSAESSVTLGYWVTLILLTAIGMGHTVS
jgi:hypothetical protein